MNNNLETALVQSIIDRVKVIIDDLIVLEDHSNVNINVSDITKAYNLEESLTNILDKL